MGLHKQIDTALSDSIKTTYHRIVEFSFNALTGKATVIVFSYISEADEEAGKAPYQQHTFTLNTVVPSPELWAQVQALLENAIVAETSEFADATIA